MEKSIQTILVAVDSGHGSETAGKRTPLMPKDVDFDLNGTIEVKKGTSIREHIANTGVCYYLVEEFKRCGIRTFKSGWDDNNAYNDFDTDITKRQELIKKAGCQYSVSVHFNAFGDGMTFNRAEGISTYYHSIDARVKDSKRLAQIVQKYLAQGSKQVNRGINRGSFGMVNCLGMNTKASILVELAFMTNEKEAIQYMGNVAFWKESAKEICKGFCEYLGVAYVEETKAAKEEIKNPKEESTKEKNPKEEVTVTVQAGVYKVKSNAVAMKKKLLDLGMNQAYMLTKVVSSSFQYYVIVGNYKDKKTALAIQAILKSKGIVSSIYK